MYQIATYNQGLGRTLASTKVGGFFSRLFKKIKDSPLGDLPFVKAILSVADYALNFDFGGGSGGSGGSFDGMGDSDMNRIEDASLTAQEQVILDAFDFNLFTPFFITLLNETKGIFSGGISLDEQLSRVNIVLAKICAIKTHFANTPAPFLSTNALRIRNEYISTTLFVIETYIYQQFKLQNFAKVAVTRNISDYFFDGLIIKSGITNFSCEEYQKTATSTNTAVSSSPIVYDAVLFDEESVTTSTSRTSYVLAAILLAAIAAAVALSKNEEKK